VDSEIASEQTHSVIFGGPGHRPSLRDRAERPAAVRLSEIASLTAITLLSIVLGRDLGGCRHSSRGLAAVS